MFLIQYMLPKQNFRTEFQNRGRLHVHILVTSHTRYKQNNTFAKLFLTSIWIHGNISLIFIDRNFLWDTMSRKINKKTARAKKKQLAKKNWKRKKLTSKKKVNKTSKVNVILLLFTFFFRSLDLHWVLQRFQAIFSLFSTTTFIFHHDI